MIDVHTSKSLAIVIGTQRETQRHLECLSRQIMARAGRQATTAKALSRARRRGGPRIYYQELVGRLTFERWVEFDMICCRLAMLESIIGELQLCDKRPGHHPAT